MTPSSSDIDVLARTIWGEDRGGGADGMTAVAWVVMNRIKHPGWWGHDVSSVCKCHMQFDTWNSNDPNFTKILTVTQSDPEFSLAMQIAASVLEGVLPDPTGGATSYYAPKSCPMPAWAKDKTPCADIGHQLYFKV